jgi:NitT/TauT family transport system permease protein
MVMSADQRFNGWSISISAPARHQLAALPELRDGIFEEIGSRQNMTMQTPLPGGNGHRLADGHRNCLPVAVAFPGGGRYDRFPSVDVARGLRELLGRGVLWAYIADSLGRVAVGFTIAALLGIPLGLTLGWYPAAAQVVNPLMQMLRPISPIAWIPLAIVWFGIGDAAAMYLIFLGAFFPITVTAMNGVRNVPSMYRHSGRNFGLTPAQLLTRIIFPAALPQIIVGLRIALGIAWLVVVAAEMIAVDSGLGYLVIDARNSGKRYDLVVAAMLLIGDT